MLPNVALRMPPTCGPGDRAEPLGREADDPGQPEDRHGRDDEDRRPVGVDARSRARSRRSRRPPCATTAIRAGIDSGPRTAMPPPAASAGARRSDRAGGRSRSGATYRRRRGMPVSAATCRAASTASDPAATSRSTSREGGLERRRRPRSGGVGPRRPRPVHAPTTSANSPRSVELAAPCPLGQLAERARARSPRGASSAPGRRPPAGPSPQAAARSRERRRDPARAPRTGPSPARRRRSARAAPAARGPSAAGTPRTTSAARRRRSRRAPRARPTRPGSGRRAPPSAAHAATSSSPGSLTAGRAGVGHEREVRAAAEVGEQLREAARAAPGVDSSIVRVAIPWRVEQPAASAGCPRRRSAARRAAPRASAA